MGPLELPAGVGRLGSKEAVDKTPMTSMGHF